MVDRGRLRRLLDRQRLETQRLRDLASHPPEELAEDEVLIAAAQFRLVVAIEAAVDIAHHVIASEGLEGITPPCPSEVISTRRPTSGR